ncbi:PaaI family thioesterase [Marinitenerispora sediminis]|uniref:Acyl-coenzyme A thioesterase THEM4 n=1 Tax=Marinitenerispora sediminis TaxID=1931232 RepID=A0A368T588_9ACTN|nr:PaaI family thioesterase [Marinitenerispora sediminis]RCV54516.1 thioesterase [Marinitenerispora sediminis]RCV58718.1 thioesterase [Marinitenerispora sediminis]RCV61380.1 thioesterase [Marinitenerispora sediminis]
MTVEAQPVAGLPDPTDFGFSVVRESEIPDELLALVARVRDLVDTVAHTEADPAELREVDAALAQVTERLAGRRRDTGALLLHQPAGGPAEYGTVTNLVAGPTNPVAPPLVLAHADGGLRGEVTLNGIYQGPPGLVHGGWLAALLDQALGAAASAAGMPGLTANLTVDYRRPTPLNVPLTVTSRVTGTERRKVFVSAEIRHDGEVTAEGTAVMVRLAIPE